jgi:hypothetical protein
MNDNTKSYVSQWLDLLEKQHRQTYALLAGISEEKLWACPAPCEWSIGEILDHTRVLNRSFRRLIVVAWPLLRPWGRLRRTRHWLANIDDVYARPDFPMSVGWLWTPRHKPGSGVTLAQLEAESSAAYRKIRAWYSNKEEDVLGNTYFYDPAIGWLNLVQVLRVAAWHDDLHFRDVRKMRNGRDRSGRQFDAL